MFPVEIPLIFLLIFSYRKSAGVSRIIEKAIHRMGIIRLTVVADGYFGSVVSCQLYNYDNISLCITILDTRYIPVVFSTNFYRRCRIKI